MTSPAVRGHTLASEQSTDIYDASPAPQNGGATSGSEKADDPQDLRRRFVLEGTSAIIACEDPPWESQDNGTIVVPAALDQRIRDRGVGCATPEKNRLHLWGMVHLARSRAVPEKDLFRSQNADRGMTFTLRPRFRSRIPLQRVHVGHGAIPDVLAGVPCKDIDLYQALDMLNDIMRTDFTLRTPGLYNCLQRCLHDYRDLGEIYGFLRPWWQDDNFRDVFIQIAHRESELDAIRKEAIRGSCIQNSRIPPRHVWDLYANRVLPLQALPRDQGSNPEDIPSSVWCVSHSWVAEEDRIEVWTKINGKRWPVPIPKTTTLDHIRIELLNMGAEYVWLDVLCLRQRGNDKQEAVRQAEWKLDVPTIGYTYSRPSTPCITYFNGLGLPLDTSTATLESHRQWFNRVWTLQESTLGWLPGGLVGSPLEDGRAFFDRLENIVRAVNGFGSDLSLAQALRARACTTELDRISGLAYIFRCRTLPIYDESVTQEDAWMLLLKHMDPHRRTEISLHYSPERPFGIWTSWETFLTSLRGTSHPGRPRLATTTSRVGSSGDVFELVDPKQLYTSEHGEYCHWGYVVHPCHVLLDSCSVANDKSDVLELSIGDEGTRFQFSVLHSHGILLEDIPYCLVSLKGDVERWALCEMIEEREVNERNVVEVARWAVIHTTHDEGARLEVLTSKYRRRAYLTYLATNEALLRSPCAGEYIQVFSLSGSDDSVTLDSASRPRYTYFGVVNSSAWVIKTHADPPWQSSHGENAAVVPRIIPDCTQSRISINYTSAKSNRANLWATVQLASAPDAAIDTLFRSAGRGVCFTIRPAPRSSIPLQWAHSGHGTIPDSLANMDISEMSHESLLQNLNSVLGTTYTVHDPGFEECLSRALDTDIRDFGEAYALLRPWWSPDLSNTLAGMAKRKNDDELLRRGALGNEFIHDPRVPPRRVWDLHSNRVVPFYFLLPDYLGRPEEIPSNVWVVAHGAILNSDVPRGSIVTSINGRQWPVSLPKATTLNHIRVELLNMGAEYVWLDVLCVRSGFGGETSEEERARSDEVQLDVPTMGYMFQSWDRPCVAYFNGLGLPLERLPAPFFLDSALFWVNVLRSRLTGHWLPGGLTVSRPVNGDAFFAQVEDTMQILSRPIGDDERLRLVVHELRRLPLHVTADEPTMLPYLLGCSTIPQDCTWDPLIEHLPPPMRTDLCLRYPAGYRGALWPSVDTICKHGPSIPCTRAGISVQEQLRFHGSAQDSQRGGTQLRYFHDGYVTGPCRVFQENDEPGLLYISFDATPSNQIAVKITGVHGMFHLDVAYRLVAVGELWKEYWIVVEVVGTRSVKNASALEAVKWGVFGTNEEEGAKLVALNLGQPRTRVVYHERTYELGAKSSMQRNS